ncbi:Na(+)/H(+) exchange regulatory cofactor NHE-RF1-like [Diretmus argenteus]
MSNLRPRLCVLEKGPSGYGFHLHGEKGKTGQFIRLVEPDSPAAAAGLLAGDRLGFVNGDSVEGESHQQVVARIRATDGPLEVIVVDADTAELLKKHNLLCRKEFVTEGIPVPGDGESDRGDAQSNGTPRESSPVPGQNGEVSLRRLSVSSKEGKAEMRPRLCHVKKGANGYGFNLHSEKTKPGQYIRAVDEDSPAQRAGLRPQDKIVQVNSVSVHGMQHSDVVAAIKAGGDETSLLVVDPETDDFFKSCRVMPTEDHLTGRLPEPMSRKESEDEQEEEEVNAKAAVEMKKVSVSSSASSSSSNASLPTRTPEVDKAVEPGPEAGGSGPAAGMSLAEAKERARQKRAAKKAPQMDWSKRNELFSNL